MRRLMRTIRMPASLVLRVLLLGFLLTLVVVDLQQQRVIRRGVESGLSETQAPLSEPRTGINVALEQYEDALELGNVLTGLQVLGYGTLRQRIAWAEIEPAPGEFRWDRWDEILLQVRDQGFRLIVILDRAPEWARSPREAHNPYAPPADPQSYAHFVAAFAARYAGYVDAYQIWDKPNIAPNWGRGEVSPAGYVTLLEAGATAIRRADPQAVIVGGALAPNTEPGGRNMSDVQFLREIYRRGGGDWFDVLGVYAYGFWTGPYDRRTDPDVLNFSRVVLLREEMVHRGDVDKPVWALDGGWVALPDGWQGQFSALGTDSPAIQAARLRSAVDRVNREWPWMTLFTALHLQPVAEPDDPVWGLSLLSLQGEPQSILDSLQALPLPDAVYYPGRHELEIDLASLASAGGERTLDLTFWGSDLAIVVDHSQAAGELWVVGAQEEPLALMGPSGGLRRHWLLRNQALSEHRLYLVGTAEQLRAVQSVQVGNRLNPLQAWGHLVVGTLASVWVAAGLYQHVAATDWRKPWRIATRAWEKLPQVVQYGALGGLFLAVVVSPAPSLRLLMLACYAACALMRPDIALMTAVVAIPLAPLQIALGPGRFSITEIAVLVAAAARALHWLLDPQKSIGWMALRREIGLLDLLVFLFVVWSGVSAWRAEYQRVALRELRVIIIEPALLYALLRHEMRRGAQRRLVALFFVSAVAVAVYGMVAYAGPAGVIRAEGVRRARAFFGSPNNLALYLERLLPLGIVVALGGTDRRRRLAYGLGAAVISLVIVLTYSRGAWLLGVPAGVIAVIWLLGGRLRWTVPVAAGLILLAFVAIGSAGRLGALTDLSQGTAFLRVQLWRAAWEMVQDHPILGLGPDNFLYYYGDYVRAGAEVDRWLSHPHNIVLDAWLRLGLPGLLLFVSMIGVAFCQLDRLTRRSQADRLVAIGLLGGLVAALAHGLIDSTFFVNELAYSIMFILAYSSSDPHLTVDHSTATLCD